MTNEQFLKWALEIANESYDGNVRDLAFAISGVYNE